MKIKKIEQIDFSSLLFDTLFGLVLFFSIDSFLDIKIPLHLVLYIFSIIIAVHWWLEFKADDDAFGDEVSNSGLDLIVGISEIILIEYIILMARTFDYVSVVWYLIALLGVDILWSLVWRFVGRWKTTDRYRIKLMEKELNANTLSNLAGMVSFASLIIFSGFMPSTIFIFSLIIIYLIFVYMKFKLKIIDINFF